MNYLKANSSIDGDGLYFLLYNPADISVYDKFSKEEWQMIFPQVDEDKFLAMCNNYEDRIFLISYTKGDQEAFGFICLQECFNKFGTVRFHGGIWKNDNKFKILLFDGLNALFNLLRNLHYNLEATCLKDNSKADRLQQALGFREMKILDGVSYKSFDEKLFKNNIYIRYRNRHGTRV